MITDNLCYDEQSSIQIPQNDSTFFIIKKSIFYKNAIDIFFDINEKIDFVNFFFIIKSFSNNLIFLPKMFLITIKNQDERGVVTFNQDPFFFKQMTYAKFVKWVIAQIENDKFYINNEKLYFISVVMFSTKPIDNLVPKYPWKKEIIDVFYKNINEELNYEKLLLEKNKEIDLLKKKIQKLKNK